MKNTKAIKKSFMCKRFQPKDGDCSSRMQQLISVHHFVRPLAPRARMVVD